MELFGVLSQHRDAVAYHMMDYIFLIFVLVLVGLLVMRTSLVDTNGKCIPVYVVQAGVVPPELQPPVQPPPTLASMEARPPGLARNVTNGVMGPYGVIMQSRVASNMDMNAFMATQLDVSNFYKSS